MCQKSAVLIKEAKPPDILTGFCILLPSISFFWMKVFSIISRGPSFSSWMEIKASGGLTREKKHAN